MSHCPLRDTGKTPQLLLLITMLMLFQFQQLQYGEYFLLLPEAPYDHNPWFPRL